MKYNKNDVRQMDESKENNEKASMIMYLYICIYMNMHMPMKEYQWTLN